MKTLLLCKENILYPRLKEKEVNWPHQVLFKSLTIFINLFGPLASDNDLEEIWSCIGRSQRYKILNDFERKGVIKITRDPQDKRTRSIEILIEYKDSFFEAWVL